MTSTLGQPRPAKRRRISRDGDNADEIDAVHVNSNTNVDFVGKGPISPRSPRDYASSNTELCTESISIGPIEVSIMETREMVEHILQYLDLEQLLVYRRVCKSWSRWLEMQIAPSSLSDNQRDVNIFPLFQRQLFELSIGSLKQFVPYFIGEYRDYPLKHDMQLRT